MWQGVIIRIRGPLTLPVNPAEDPGVGRVGHGVGDPVGPVFRQTVLLCHRP